MVIIGIKDLERRVEGIEKHVEIINKEMGDTRECLAKSLIEIKWIRWFVMINLVAWLGIIAKFLIL